QQVERYLRAEGRWEGAEQRIAALHAEAAARGVAPPVYKGALPRGHDGSGLALLGVTGDELIPREVYERIRAEALEAVRGTVQARAARCSRTTCRHRAGACTRARSPSTTSARRCRPSMRCSTTATACTPMPTTRRSPRRPRRA